MKRRLPAFLTLLCLTILTAACGMVPQPFRPYDGSKSHNDFLILKESYGIAVLPVEGLPAPLDRQVAHEMALTLQSRGLAASASASNRASYFLSSSAELTALGPAATKYSIRWDLVDRAGQPVDAIASSINVAKPATTYSLAPMVAQTASLISEKILGPSREQRESDQFKITVMEVSGAPGDGNKTLRSSLALELKSRSFAVSDQISTNGVIILGDVNVSPVSDKEEEISLSWSMITPGGEEIATIGQQNRIPKGQLDGPWGEIAVYVAEAASDGIVDVLIKLQKEREKNRKNGQ